MKFEFDYNEPTPTIDEYKTLIVEMRKLSKEFFDIDKIFENDFNIDIMSDYEIKKEKIINKMFKKIISNFPKLNEVPCAIYLNGSYARKSITANSDLDLTFFFNEADVSNYQTLIYLVRNAVATMFDVNVVHVHSFAKNFTTEYRKENNLVIPEQQLETEITWRKTEGIYKIDYPENQMMAEREICEITSIKDMKSLENLFESKIKKYHPKEWIYTHECVHITDDSFSIENLIKKLDSEYSNEEIKISLNNIRKEIEELLTEIAGYYNDLSECDEIELSKYNMIGKRKVMMLVYCFIVYLRWFYIYNNLKDVPKTLNLDLIFNYKNNLIEQKEIEKLKQTYNYFRFLISRIEIWTKKYNHHFEHRSVEVVRKETLNKEYKDLWKNKYSPIKEQIDTFTKISKKIKCILDDCTAKI